MGTQVINYLLTASIPASDPFCGFVPPSMVCKLKFVDGDICGLKSSKKVWNVVV